MQTTEEAVVFACILFLGGLGLGRCYRVWQGATHVLHAFVGSFLIMKIVSVFAHCCGQVN